MEIASYKILMAAAEQVGDLETRQVCEQNLHEEEEMAAWLDVQIAYTTHQYLDRVEMDDTANI